MSKKGKILLISPNLKGIQGGINRIQPGLGIGYLAAVLEQNGHEVYVRDTALEGHNNVQILDSKKTIEIGESDDAISNYISQLNPDIIGISVLFSNLADHAYQVSKIAKKVNPKIHVILGGNHVTNAISDYNYGISSNADTSQFENPLSDIDGKNIDYLMVGESEYQFLDLVNALMNNKNPDGLSGLVSRKKGAYGMVVNSNKSSTNLKDLPHPARHLMNMEGYFKIGLFHSTKSHSNRVLNVMASRGCPEVCSFCTTPEMWGTQVRWRDPQDIFEEIKNGIDQLGIGEVQFEDDTLTANRPHLMELCDLIEPLGIPWCTPNGTKLNYHMKQQPDMFKRMQLSGCYQITFAAETGVQRVMDAIVKKKLLIEQIKPAIENAKEAGMLVHTFWIVGFPGETREEMEKTIEFAAGSGADSYSVAILTPLPGTPVFRKVVENNLWWDSTRGIKDMLYRNSLIKVDGFKSSEEFQKWVNEQNYSLNSLLEKNDPQRAKLQNSNRGARHLQEGALKIKQT
jgi:radical SAM superfamily enzyme YgiQ (UPF0313 family)